MIKLKKLLFTLGITGLTSTSLTTIISCGNNIEIKPTKLTDTNISLINTLENQKEVDEALNNGTFKQLDIALVTGFGGNINDNSFTQSLWEAISHYSKQVKSQNHTALKTNNEKNILANYNALLKEKYNVWVLAGFQHSNVFKQWLNNPNNLKKIKDKKITIIAVDWEVEKEFSDKILGQFISLNYKVEQASWITGYASADFLAKIYPTKMIEKNGQLIDENEINRVVAVFGAIPSKSVTDFIAGYLWGIKTYNETPGNEVTKLSHDENVTLNTSFKIDTYSKGIINSIVSFKKPQIILPIAGSMTKAVLDVIKANNKTTQRIIGVDSNVAKIYKENSNKFFTSIEKRIGMSLYNVLIDLFLKKGNKSIYIPNFVSITENNPQNEKVTKGWNDEFVGLSESTLSGKEKVIAQKSLDLAIQKFQTLSNSLNIPKMIFNELDKNEKEINKIAKIIKNQTKIRKNV